MHRAWCQSSHQSSHQFRQRMSDTRPRTIPRHTAQKPRNHQPHNEIRPPHPCDGRSVLGGAYRDRTDDLPLAKGAPGRRQVPILFPKHLQPKTLANAAPRRWRTPTAKFAPEPAPPTQRTPIDALPRDGRRPGLTRVPLRPGEPDARRQRRRRDTRPCGTPRHGVTGSRLAMAEGGPPHVCAHPNIRATSAGRSRGG